MLLTITLSTLYVVPLYKAAIADKEIKEKGETVSGKRLLTLIYT